MKSITKILFIVLACALIISPAVGVLNQKVFAQNSPEREAQLRAELDQVLRDIADQQKILDAEKQKGASIERDLAILNAKIKEAKLSIRARELAIQGLGKDINIKTQTINTLTGKIDNSRESLAELMRKTNEVDQLSLVDVVLSNENVSDFFEDVDAYDSIKQSITVALDGIKKSKEETEVAKQTLDKKRLQEIDAKISIEAEKKKIEVAEKEKARLLSLSKEQQKNYKNEITKKESRAAAIRSALFSLRDTGAIPFGQALDYAQAASKQTGVRPAFILAILSQESNLGANVGACVLSDTTTGYGVKASTGTSMGKIMHTTRDLPVFLNITRELGIDPLTTKVSCPIGGVGYGGAMGPSQFIPSTWILFKDRIAQLSGSNPPNPWNAHDAFMASALYLSDLGASSGTYSAERNAACRYYSGRSCDSRKPANSFYGDSVMQKAKTIQTTMIDPLS